ncbi:terminase large subunit [Liquorilactobacillus mali]|uniref:Prophage Lp3 protein 15, terminase large subunit n=2 Tax=Liquorilactobacillus TaxID=2767888 RepID=J0UTS3_9LACO|nr:terminase TerL endonuclease subunit [Liquorilactobacillus mali]EJF00898.1 prophage P2b protein 15, terminase large subunit [Liquorilactobacillus mali KCTC 3596 = DSM 20444]KRN11474.1 prophage Lp3 protein 15, terminase large subunit [Liquorilactobacillus mali KCTC 3596 = DSM 20444]QFQ74225.1 terminase large subunit [Liquorilactobacillus mali]
MIKYVDDVLAGRILVGKKIRLACERFKRDLGRSKTDEFNYYYDEEEATKAVKFIESLPKTDGSKLDMQPFQEWIISELYGWKEKDTGFRRYDRAFISMARKNGKTYLASGVAANGLLREKSPAMNRQVLFVSNGLKQAKLGYNMLSSGLNQVRKKSKYMRQRIKVQKQEIEDLESGSKAIALASDTSTLDGFAGTTIVLDEWHEAKDRKVYNVLKSGQAQEDNSLLAVISTSGLNLNVPMHAEYEMLNDVLNGKAEADRYFIAIWELDDREEVYDQNNWVKANPLFSEPKVKKKMTEKIKADVDLAIKQNNMIPILVKNFNMWLQASEDSYISADDWSVGKVKSINLNNRDIYIGVDLSKSNDLTAVSWIIPTGDGHFYCDSHSWIGTKYGLDSKIKRDGIDYRSMERAKECTITRLESGIIDYDAVFEYIQSIIGKYNFRVKAIAYDPYNFDALLTKFEKANYPLFEVRQGTKTLNIPTRDFREKLYDGKIQHNGNKILAYAVNNAILKVDNNGWQIDKARNSNRIDPIAALINAYVAGMDYYEESEANQHANDYYTSAEFSF